MFSIIIVGICFISAAFEDSRTMEVSGWKLYGMLLIASGYQLIVKKWFVVIICIVIFLILLWLQKYILSFGEADIYAVISVLILFFDMRFFLWMSIAIILAFLFYFRILFRREPIPFFPAMAGAYIIMIGGSML